MIDKDFYEIFKELSEDTWVPVEKGDGWLPIEIAYAQLRNHWLVKLAIKLRIIKL